MLERAEEYPLCALVLLELRMGTVVKMMQNAERLRDTKGCVKYFFTALRLAMPLFAVTHKTGYMLLCTELLKWYHCASPAARVIYEEFIFTRLTSTGKPCFHDLMVEKTVNDIRKTCGKVYHKGIDVKMEVAAATLPTQDSRDASIHALHNNKPSSTSGRTCNYLSNDAMCPFYNVVKKMEEMCLWTPGETPKIRTKGNKLAECNVDVLEVPGGQLHADILSSITDIGRERVIQYFIEFCIKTQGEQNRSSDVVDLRKLDTTVSRIIEARDNEIKLRTSTNSGDFKDKIFTKALLVVEIDRHRDAEKEKKNRVSIPAATTSEKKQALVDKLVKCRQKIFKKNRSLKDEILSDIKTKFQQKGRSAKAARKVLLENELFKLSESVRSLERYSKPSTT